MKDSEVIAQLEAIEEEQRALDARRMAVLDKLSPDQRKRVEAWMRKLSPEDDLRELAKRLEERRPIPVPAPCPHGHPWPGRPWPTLEATGNNTGPRVQPDLPPVRSPFGGLGGVVA